MGISGGLVSHDMMFRTCKHDIVKINSSSWFVTHYIYLSHAQHTVTEVHTLKGSHKWHTLPQAVDIPVFYSTQHALLALPSSQLHDRCHLSIHWGGCTQWVSWDNKMSAGNRAKTRCGSDNLVDCATSARSLSGKTFQLFSWMDARDWWRCRVCSTANGLPLLQGSQFCKRPHLWNNDSVCANANGLSLQQADKIANGSLHFKSSLQLCLHSVWTLEAVGSDPDTKGLPLQ